MDAFIAEYENVAPGAMACQWHDLEACLTFSSSPKEHGKAAHNQCR